MEIKTANNTCEGMESLGKYLKMQRESRNLSLKEVYLSTKILVDVLKAVEEDQYEVLESLAYVKGFLRSYAKYLGLNPNEIILRYQRYLEDIRPPKRGVRKQQATSQNLRLQALAPQKSINFRLLVLFFVITLLIVFVIFWNYRSSVPSTKKEERRVTALPSIPSSLPIQKGTDSKAAMVGGPSEPEVTEAGLGTGIERKDGFFTLVGKRLEFVCNGQKVYLVSRIKAKREGKIIHVWFRKGEEFYRRKMEVKLPQWTVYSYIILWPGQGGDWKVEVRRGDRILVDLSFRAVEPSSNSKYQQH